MGLFALLSSCVALIAAGAALLLTARMLRQLADLKRRITALSARQDTTNPARPGELTGTGVVHQLAGLASALGGVVRR